METDEDGPVAQRLIQYQQSDLDLLVEVAQRFGLYVTLRDDVLHLIRLEGMGEGVELEFGKNPVGSPIGSERRAGLSFGIGKGLGCFPNGAARGPSR